MKFHFDAIVLLGFMNPAAPASEIAGALHNSTPLQKIIGVHGG